MSRVFVLLGIFVALPACGSAGESPELCRMARHPMRYYIARPVAAGQRTPVLIALAGADGDFAGHARRFHKARGERRVVLVVPCTFISANRMTGSTYQRFRDVYEDDLIHQVGGGLVPNVRERLSWDEAGLMTVIRDLRERGMKGDLHLTGFSAGGILAWWMALKHPDTFASVVPVCSNFPFCPRCERARSRKRPNSECEATSGKGAHRSATSTPAFSACLRAAAAFSFIPRRW